MNYEIRYVRGHVEVYDQMGRFRFSADSEWEALEELEQVVRAGAHGGEEVPFLLSTIHSSKGLEYGRVILMDVADGIFPKTVPEGPEPEQAELDAYEEERRLFYVGMTRAKDVLKITYVKIKNGKEISPSRFVEELFEGV